MKVNLIEFEVVQNYLNKINEKDLTDLELWYNGKKLEFSEEELEEFKYYGLNNTTFIRLKLDEINVTK